MRDVHEPPRLVRAHRHQREVDAGVAVPDELETVAVRGVPGEVDALVLRGQHPAAPQRLAGVEQRPAAPVVGGHEVEGHLADLGALPPVELRDVREPLLGEPARQIGGDEDRSVPRQAAHRRCVKMVVVVVADHDGVHRGQVAPGHAGRCQPLPHSRDLPRPDGVRQHRQAPDAQHVRRVAHPCDRRVRRGDRGQTCPQHGDLVGVPDVGAETSVPRDAHDLAEVGQRAGQAVLEVGGKRALTRLRDRGNLRADGLRHATLRFVAEWEAGLFHRDQSPLCSDDPPWAENMPQSYEVSVMSSLVWIGRRSARFFSSRVRLLHREGCLG